MNWEIKLSSLRDHDSVLVDLKFSVVLMDRNSLIYPEIKLIEFVYLHFYVDSTVKKFFLCENHFYNIYSQILHVHPVLLLCIVSILL